MILESYYLLNRQIINIAVSTSDQDFIRYSIDSNIITIEY